MLRSHGKATEVTEFPWKCGRGEVFLYGLVPLVTFPFFGAAVLIGER